MFSVLGAAGSGVSLQRAGLQRASTGSQLLRRNGAGIVPRRGHTLSGGRQQLPTRAETLRVQGTEKQTGGGAAGDVEFKQSGVDGDGEASRLHMLVEEGRLEELQRLLQQGCDPNAVDYDWDSDEDSDGDPNEDPDEDSSGMTLVHKAARAGNVECIRLLVQGGADMEARGWQGCTPLHLAATYGHGAACKELVALGASLGSRDSQGNSPLFWAALADEGGEGVRALVQLGASPNERDPRMGATPLHAAALYGTVGADRALLELGADVDAADSRGLRPLHAAAMGTAPTTIAVAQLLVLAGADVSARDNAGRTPLHWAAIHGKVPFIQFLLSAGADHKARDNDGFTPAQLAAQQSHAEASVILDAAGTQEFHQGTLSHSLPPMNSNKAFLELPESGLLPLEELCTLLQQGLHPDTLTTDDLTLLQRAAGEGSVGAIRMLVHHGANLNYRHNKHGHTPLHLAAAFQHPAACRELVALGARLNARDNGGSTPLMLAAANDKIGDCVRVLVEAGANIKCMDAEGEVALHNAVRAGLLGPAKLLLEAGATAPGNARAGMWALHVAAASERPNAVAMVRLLLAAGVPVSAVNEDGMTPLHAAALMGNAEVARALLQAGARVEASDNEGRTAAQVAAQEGHAEVELLLRQAA